MPEINPFYGETTVPLLRALSTAALLAALLYPSDASAQLDRLRKAAGSIAEQAPIGNLAEKLAGDSPVTTSLPDAVWGDETMDGWNPDVPAASMLDLERSADGGFVLQPGYWEMHTQSYCLKAGTHGPGGGDGYLYAPPAGPAEAAIVAILRGSVDRPEVAQRDIQVLLWAIIARAKFEDLEPRLKAVAATFLTPEMLARLNRGALDLVPQAALDRALDGMPPLVRQVIEAEARLRRMMTEPGTTFDQMERVAVLAGLAPPGEGSRAVPEGRWSRHPDGYYVRYVPQGYSYTVTQIWVPEGSPAIRKEYDPAMHIAVPGNTSRQRLIQSGRAHAPQS